MKALAYLATFAVTVFACLWAAFAGLAAAGGRDIGFAGGGIWFLFLPGAILGPIVIFVISRFTKLPPQEPLLQRVMFVAVSGALSFCLGAAPIGLMRLQAKHEQANTYVYAPAANFISTLEITMPAVAMVGVAVPVESALKQGPWERVSYAELRESRFDAFSHYSVTQPPPAVQKDGHRLYWASDPPQPGDRFDFEEARGPVERPPAALIFRAPGTYRVWAIAHDPKETRSNTVAITVAAPEFVYVPAPGYRAEVEVDVPAQAVQFEPFMPKATARRGPWERIPFAALKHERYRNFARRYSVDKPVADEDVTWKVSWFTSPSGALNVKEPLPNSPGRWLVFMNPGTIEVRAALWGEQSPVESNPVAVSVKENWPKQ